jgi:hypothetical protein
VFVWFREKGGRGRGGGERREEEEEVWRSKEVRQFRSNE